MEADHPLSAVPVGLAAGRGGGRRLHSMTTWETVSGTENRGFNLYRGTSDAGPIGRLQRTLIPSRSQNSSGFIYTWEDRADAGVRDDTSTGWRMWTSTGRRRQAVSVDSARRRRCCVGREAEHDRH